MSENQTSQSLPNSHPDPQFCYLFEGQKYFNRDRFITVQEIRAAVGEHEQPLIQELDDGSEPTLAEDARVDLVRPCRFGVRVRIKRGTDAIQARLDAEVALVCERYPAFRILNGSWAELPNFEFPKGKYNRAQDTVSFTVPASVLTAPPDMLFVSPGLRRVDSGMPENYSEGKAPNGDTKGIFSFHAEVWRPTADVRKGSNLLGYIRAIKAFLAEGR
jgi:hypothetical protein